MVDISFILVKPKVAENIGASARAIKTMGFSKLFMVAPFDYDTERAYRLAHGSQEVLDDARIFKTLPPALKEHDLVVGTTARKRISKSEYISLDRLKPFLSERKNEYKRVAIVFGTEESGLSNEEIALCDIVSTIPMAAPYPSLNLSQAVMIYAYALSETVIEDGKEILTGDGPGSMELLKTRVNDLLSGTTISNNRALIGRIMERLALAPEKDIRLMHSITSSLLEKYGKEKK